MMHTKTKPKLKIVKPALPEVPINKGDQKNDVISIINDIQKEIINICNKKWELYSKLERIKRTIITDTKL